MNILASIIRKLLFLEVRTDNGSTQSKLWAVTRHGAGRFTFKQLEADDNTLKKWKHGLVIVAITGDEVAQRPYSPTDASLKKITENENLIWTLHHPNVSEGTISFVRKAVLEDCNQLFNAHSVHKAREYVIKQDEADKETLIEAFFQETVYFKPLFKDVRLLNTFSHVIYQKFQLPILLVIFALLLGNFFVNGRLRDEYDGIQSQLNAKRKNEKQLLENNQNIGKMEKHYQNFYLGSFALIADRIASYVPANISLNLCSIFPRPKNEEFALENKPENKALKNIILVRGEVETPGSVTLFTQLLGADKMFSKVEMLSLVRQKDQELYSFELQITL